MQRRINILSLAVLFIYGTLTLVAVPLHHHAMNYVDSPQYQTVITHHGFNCSVCTFNSQSVSVELPSALTAQIATPSQKLQSIELPKYYHSQFVKEYPRRGPPPPLV